VKTICFPQYKLGEEPIISLEVREYELGTPGLSRLCRDNDAYEAVYPTKHEASRTGRLADDQKIEPTTPQNEFHRV